MPNKYTRDQIKKLASKINKFTNKNDFIKIFEILKDEIGDSVTENNNGLFMFFHNLSDDTYEKIEKEVKRVNKKKNYYTDSESISKKEYTPYMQDDFPTHKDLSPKFKYSNTEKNLIKRRHYNENVNNTDDNVVYTKFNVNLTDSEVVSESKK